MNAPFCSQVVGNAIYGMREMSSDIPEVRKMLTAITAKVAVSNGMLMPQVMTAPPTTTPYQHTLSTHDLINI